MDIIKWRIFQIIYYYVFQKEIKFLFNFILNLKYDPIWTWLEI